MKRYSLEFRKDACNRKLVEELSQNRYRLLSAGEEMLDAEQPLEEQIKLLQQASQAIVKKWRIAHKTVQKSFEGANGKLLQAAAAELATQAEQALEDFNSKLASFFKLTELAKVIRKAHEELETAARKAQQVFDAESKRLSDIKEELQKQAQEQQKEMQLFEEKVGKIAQKLHSNNGLVSQANTQNKDIPDRKTIWETVKIEHEKLRLKTLKIGGIVTVPELTDAVQQDFPILTSKYIHDLFEEWQQESKLTLQLCNDPRLEPRATEGIQSPSGLLYYVKMR